MKFIPHDYQQYAIQFLTEHPVAALLLDMGLGKTVTTLTAINELLFDRFEIRRVLVIAPLRVARDTWSAEIEKWEHLKHLKYSVAVGTPASSYPEPLLPQTQFFHPASIRFDPALHPFPDL